MDTVNWSVLFRLVDKNVTSEYSVCSFSPCGQYMAAGTVKGEFSLWNVKSSCPIRESTSGADNYPITSLAWNPSGNGEVVYADSAGQIGMVRLVLADEPEDHNADALDEDVDDIYNNSEFLAF
jgi:chromosome transmission fidelity protein 4